MRRGQCARRRPGRRRQDCRRRRPSRSGRGSSCLRHSSWRCLQQQVDAAVRDGREPQTLVQPQSPVVLLDVDAHALPAPRSLGEQLAHEARAHPGAAMLREQGDVHDPDLVLPARDVQAAGRLAVDLDHVERRAVVVLAVVRVLRVELPTKEGFPFRLVPRNPSELVLADRRVDASQEAIVAVTNGPQVRARRRDGHQDRGGNTPCSAMQKLNVRYGCMLLCGWSPPAGARTSGAMALTLFAGAYMFTPSPAAKSWPVGTFSSASCDETEKPCECAGISLSSRVTVSLPPVSPRSCSERPGP